MELKQAIAELRKEDSKKKFVQSVDLIVNLKGIDVKRDNVNAVIPIPHKIKDKKVCGFLTEKNELVKTVTKAEFDKYKLVNEFDFFISHSSLMPSVATTFGKVLGPVGKMPTPQLGIVMQETPESIRALLAKIDKSVKIKMKEASIKISVGKESMKDEELIANIKAVYEGIVNALPTKRENIKNVKVKLTMSKPIGVEIK